MLITGPVEIILWLVALACGLVSAVLLIILSSWILPLLTGLAAIVILFVLSYIQPALWVCILLDLALLGSVVFMSMREKKKQ